MISASSSVFGTCHGPCFARPAPEPSPHSLLFAPRLTADVRLKRDAKPAPSRRDFPPKIHACVNQRKWGEANNRREREDHYKISAPKKL